MFRIFIALLCSVRVQVLFIAFRDYGGWNSRGSSGLPAQEHFWALISWLNLRLHTSESCLSYNSTEAFSQYTELDGQVERSTNSDCQNY